MQGFFSSSAVVADAPNSLLPKCGACGFYKTCQSPKIGVQGKGRKGVLFVGDYPGHADDQKGVFFSGKTGEYLRRCVSALGVDFGFDLWLTSALICKPDRTVSDNHVAYCRPNLRKLVQTLEPEVIVPFGGHALKSVLGLGLWKENVGSVDRWAGFQIPAHSPNAWVCPMHSPEDVLKSNNPVMEMMFQKNLEDVFALKGRPWGEKGPPDYGSKVQLLYSEAEVLPCLERMFQNERPVAVDYETNMLKPDSLKARVHSCSFSDGSLTFAFPWFPRGSKVWRLVREFWLSGVRKIASNFKFENRWTMKEFGVWPEAWEVDTMLMAHVLDCRRSISSIKFQSFVLLGEGGYEEKTKPFLQSAGSNEENRIKDIALPDLLLYNGLDSLLEWKVARIQKRAMGF